MAANLIIAPEAEQDLDDGYAWYEAKRVGLGDEFLTAVDACIQAVTRTPLMHSLFHENYRRALVRRFPYVIFYEYVDDTDTVTVYCVFHTSQDPNKWRQRLS